MKRILIIDESDLFRDFLSKKLLGYGFEVIEAANGFDGIVKMRQEIFDLIIMDFYLSRNSSLEVLERKIKDPNLKSVPVIIASAKVDRESLLQVANFGVKKIFSKPIKIDALVKAVAELLHVNLEVDSTPCIIDANFNDEIIFVEIARGLNRDKIELLKYRLQELLDLYKVPDPKVLMLMSGLEIGPNDSLQLASLFSIVVEFSKAKPHNIKVLTASDFVKKFLSSRPAYNEIEVVDNIEAAMDSLLGRRAGKFMDESNVVSAKFLSSSAPSGESSSGFNLHFEEESGKSKAFDLKELGNSVSVAIVDDDFVIREIMKKALSSAGIRTTTYEDGNGIINDAHLGDYDLIFLDLMMPNTDGFKVLDYLRETAIEVPVIVLSALSKQETVVKALRYGVKSYIVKPVTPEGIYKKAIEVLRMNF